MTTWYVHRRPDGSVASAHREPIAGYAEEAIDEADPSLDPLLRPAGPTALERVQAFIQDSAVLMAIIDELADSRGITRPQMLERIASKID